MAGGSTSGGSRDDLEVAEGAIAALEELIPIGITEDGLDLALRHPHDVAPRSRPPAISVDASTTPRSYGVHRGSQGPVTMTSDAALRRQMGQLVGGVMRVGSGQQATLDGVGTRRTEPGSVDPDKFLSRIGHELRTPLTTILGFGELLQMETLTEGQQQQVDRIVGAGRRLLDLVNEILDIARMEASDTPMDLEPTDVNQVVSETVAIMGPLASERNVRIWVDSDGSSGVMADRQRLQRILLHLLSNAVRYNHQSGQVVVSATMAQDQVRLSVTDTGPGIPADWLTRLFVPFDRLDSESSGVAGAGVGLSESKALVDAMQGSLMVESHLGQGSTFTVILPAADLPPSAHLGEQDHRRAGAQARGAEESYPPVVLYAEDRLKNLVTLEEAARERGASLHVAVQGRMCVALARELRPALVVLNPDLPDLTGETVLSMLRADSATAAIPVALLAADGERTWQASAISSDVRAILEPPVDLPAVRGVLDRCLPPKPAQASLRRSASPSP